MSLKSNPTIRRANSDDADLLAELGARTFSETFAADNTPEDMALTLLLRSVLHTKQQSWLTLYLPS
ncbi:MAG: hypothetical protein M3458_24085 [Acidobacteriota bacterium]|nr:hypothetical protein [Acidobacteriota bacterium]